VGLDCLGYRLPTEAEWEALARGGTTSDFHSGELTVAQNDCDDEDAPPHLLDIGWFCANAPATRPVRGRLPNPFGLYDMAGNVHEWVFDDWRSTYPEGPLVDPYAFQTGASDRVYRGGSFKSSPRGLQHGSRFRRNRHDRHEEIGFRLVRTAF
jgi:formylglycine-generating enzyme